MRTIGLLLGVVPAAGTILLTLEEEAMAAMHELAGSAFEATPNGPPPGGANRSSSRCARTAPSWPPSPRPSAHAPRPEPLSEGPREGEAAIVPAGARILLPPADRGLRAYLAVRGGIDTECVLGSTDTLPGLGRAPLRTGDSLAIGRDVGALRTVDPGGHADTSPPGTDVPGPYS